MKAMSVTDTISAESPPNATRKEWVGLVVLSIACMLYSMDLSVLFLAMPVHHGGAQSIATQLLWINDIYGFMVAGFLVTMGTLGDLMAGARCCSGRCRLWRPRSFAPSPQTAGQLIVGARAAGHRRGHHCALHLSLIFNMFQREDERNRAIGVWGTAFAVGGTGGAGDWRRAAASGSTGVRCS